MHFLNFLNSKNLIHLCPALLLNLMNSRKKKLLFLDVDSEFNSRFIFLNFLLLIKIIKFSQNCYITKINFEFFKNFKLQNFEKLFYHIKKNIIHQKVYSKGKFIFPMKDHMKKKIKCINKK
jgi:hypothetical protein